jgi:hypothetical protein
MAQPSDRSKKNRSVARRCSNCHSANHFDPDARGRVADSVAWIARCRLMSDGWMTSCSLLYWICSSVSPLKKGLMNETT